MSDLDNLRELRAHHQREIDRIDSAIELLRQVAKLTRKATKTVRKVRQHAASSTKPKPIAVYDVVREVFRSAPKRTMTREDVMELSGLTKMTDLPGRHGSPEGKARRIIGLGLAGLVRRREIKKTRDGYVVRALDVPATSNGHAPA